MLWIEKYRPRTFDDIIGQYQVVDRLRTFARSGSVPHLLFTGPPGTGKSVSIECLSRSLYGDHWRENAPLFQAGDFFSLGKQYLEQDERYAHLYHKDQSLVSNFKYIIKWYASQRPLDAEFKLMVFDDAAALSREAQQALRRIMERFSRTCRFVYCTPHPTGLIPAISSRCLPFFCGPIPDDLIVTRLKEILLADESRGGSICSDDQLDLIVQAAHGDLRRATMLLQVAVESRHPFDLTLFLSGESSMVAAAAFMAMRSGDLPSAIRRIESLMIEYGLSSREVLRELRAIARREYNDPRIAVAIGETDYIIGHCNNEYIQLNMLSARIIQEIFS
jgi:replication factor C small subunit